MEASVPDSTLVYLSLSAALAVYLVLGFVSSPGSNVPLLASVFIFCNMLSRTAAFQGLVRRTAAQATQSRRFGIFRALARASADENNRFSALALLSQTELLEALVSLREYGANSRRSNERRRRLFKMMSWRQQRLCNDAGYLGKLQQIDAHVAKNQCFFDAIVEATEAEYELSLQLYAALDAQRRPVSQNTSSSNYRVVEALGHFVRDWSPCGEAEIAPMMEYIKTQLDAVVVPEHAARTCIVIPGSGLGRVAHEIAMHREYGAVHAVEFSGLMHACHQHMYLESLQETHRIYPHVHTTSNTINTAAQFREYVVPAGLLQPANLHLHLDDFRFFSVPSREEYDHIVVVSAFFLDTAENIMDYFDQINQLAVPSKKAAPSSGFWINFGPLKYGSAAQAELSDSEIAHIRRSMGWVDRHSLNTVEDPRAEFSKSRLPGSGLSGYITNEQSMWQGYYGISMWTSGHKANREKRS